MNIRETILDDMFIPIDFVDVPSKSDPDVTHKVKIMLDDTYSCDCKGYKYAGKCWKQVQFRFYLRINIIVKKTANIQDLHKIVVDQ